MRMEIEQERIDAKNKGETRYISKRLCPRGDHHNTEQGAIRMSRNAQCVRCYKEDQNAYLKNRTSVPIKKAKQKVKVQQDPNVDPYNGVKITVIPTIEIPLKDRIRNLKFPGGSTQNDK